MLCPARTAGKSKCLDKLRDVGAISLYRAVLRLARRVSVPAQIARQNAMTVAQCFDLRGPIRVIAREAVNEH